MFVWLIGTVGFVGCQSPKAVSKQVRSDDLSRFLAVAKTPEGVFPDVVSEGSFPRDERPSLLARLNSKPKTSELTERDVETDLTTPIEQVGFQDEVGGLAEIAESVVQQAVEISAPNFEDTPKDGVAGTVESKPNAQITGVTQGLESDFPLISSDLSDSNLPTLQLSDVLASVKAAYPEIEIAIGELEAANGKVLSSWGEFDSVFSAHSISQPLGFYQTYRNGVGISRPLYGGGEVYGTYRIGDGNFEPWYGERETNEGGELKAGFSLPFLKDRYIDARRAALMSAGAMREEVGATVEARLLQFQRFATQAYWDWVASGQAVEIQRRLLTIAQIRVKQISERVTKGDLARIANIDNDRLIAKRQNSLIKARRSFEKSSIKLSIFYRDELGSPVIPVFEQLPNAFPNSSSITPEQVSADVSIALSVRPELVALDAARQVACVELRYAENLMLPKLDMKGFAGQDLGGETSSLGDKTPFELQLGLFAEVPLQRREGLGKRQAASGKLTQIDAKRQFVSDKIRAEIQDAASALNAAYDQIQQSKANVELTRRSLELAKIAFEEGDIDLIALNIYENAVADAELQLLDAQFKYFLYQTVYETAKSGTAFQ